MSRKKKRIGIKIAAALFVVAGAGAAFYMKQQSDVAEDTTGTQYKEETVQRGSVATGITESGTVTFGSQEQEFSVAEIVEVSTSSDSSSTSQSSSAQSTDMGAAGMSGAMAMGMSGTEQSSSSSGSYSGGTETSLEVEEVYAAVGQVVEEGDAILKITQESIDEYRSSLEAAVQSAALLVKQEEINVESKRAEADYTYQMYLANGKTAQETYDATIASLENEVEELEEDLQESSEALAEYQEDEANGEDVEDEIEEEELNYGTIEANLQIARNNLTTQSIEAKQTYENAMTNYQYADQLYEIDTNGLEDDLEEAKDTLEEAEAALEEFEAAIGDGVVYAQYAGTVLSLEYEAGDYLANDTTVATYSDPDEITISVSVSQEDIAEIAVGNGASITLSAYENESFSGEVESISSSSSIGSSTVNYDVVVRFTDDTSKVYSGMTGDVTFVEKEAADALCISNKAVRQDGARSYVKVKDEDGTISEVTIKTGFSNGKTVEVTDGLEEGQTVLIESQVNE